MTRKFVCGKEGHYFELRAELSAPILHFLHNLLSGIASNYLQTNKLKIQHHIRTPGHFHLRAGWYLWPDKLCLYCLPGSLVTPFIGQILICNHSTGFTSKMQNGSKFGNLSPFAWKKASHSVSHYGCWFECIPCVYSLFILYWYFYCIFSIFGQYQLIGGRLYLPSLHKTRDRWLHTYRHTQWSTNDWKGRTDTKVTRKVWYCT